MCHALPSAWPKLRRTSKLYMWRLDDPKLHAARLFKKAPTHAEALQTTLIEDLNLVFAALKRLF